MRNALITLMFLLAAGATLAQTDPCAERLGPGLLDRSTPCIITTSLPRDLVRVDFAKESTVLSPEAVAIADRLASLLKRHPEFMIGMTGNCDTLEASSEKERVAKGLARAEAVADYLVKQGIDRIRIETHGNPGPPMVPAVLDETSLSRMRYVSIGILQR